MSRRGPAVDPAEKNRNTLKQLVKLETNKSCADCKRNKHPRWASWNLGVFMCIRCSGIHRGMGTHISRVKSVDLDTWTDEQLASMLRWGNARANKYWEAKLAPGHMPSEAKIENFIRTKYDSKRWVMDGPMPDPSTLEVEGDDDVPLNVVQEKAKMERSASQREAVPPPPPGRAGPSAITRHAPVVDLFGDEPMSTPARPSTGPPLSKPAPKAEPAPPKATKPADSLLGLDFFGSAPAAPPDRPSSTSAASANAATSRPDLKQSILSLYASKPAAAAPVSQQQYQTPVGQFGGMTSTQTQSPPPQQSAFGGMNDAFGGLNFGAPAAQQPAKPSPFAGLAGMSSSKSSAAPPKATSAAYGGGGSFFDTQTSPPKAAAQPAAPARGFSSNSGFGDFFSSTSPAATPAAAAPSQGGNDLFDIMGGGSTTMPAASNPASAAYNNSAFNLSNPSPASKPAAPAQSSFANLSSNDVWGSSNDAWSDSKPAASAPAPMSAASNNGWAAPSGGVGTTPKVTSTQVTADDDFGGWSSAPNAPTTTGVATPAKPGAFNSANDDLFSNVWE